MKNTQENNTINEGPSADVRLSEHFRLSEMTRSATAIRRRIDNTPQDYHIESLQDLCEKLLEPIRARFGVVRITSGFRSVELNEAIGGSKTSQHLYGEAADIHAGSLEVARKMFYYIRDNLEFDQMILEMKRGRVHCLHVSYRTYAPNRRRVIPYYHMK